MPRNRIRAEILIRQTEIENEWTHKDRITFDEEGITFDWDDDHISTFVPWPSLVRIDYVYPCDCVECKERRPQ